jgi:hypothetical protein
MKHDRGYASFHALVIMVFATMGGAYLLRSASKEAGTAGGYFQMRSAATSADAGLAAGLSQLQADTSVAMSILEDYMRDKRNQWMLGASGATPSANSMTLGTGQRFAARILAFDAVTGLIKIESQGSGMAGSAERVTGIFRLDGLETPMPGTASTPALFVAGDGRVASAPLVIDGPTYFGGGVKLAASGNNFNGAFKAAAYGSNPVDLQGSSRFGGDAYFETPVVVRSGATFAGRLGLDDDATLNAGATLTAAGKAAYVNGLLTGGQRIDMGGNAFVYSGLADPLKVVNASSRIKVETGLDVPGRMGMLPGVEEAPPLDLSAIPPGNIRTLDQVGLGATATGKDLIDCFHRFQNESRFGPKGQWMVVEVNRPFAFVRSADPAENECYKWFVWIVRSTLTVNGNLFTSVECPPPSTYDYLHPLQVFHVVDGGSIVGFGGPGRFRGYINVMGTGSVTYQWGPGGYLEGAVHHVSAASGFSVAGPNPMHVTFDQEVIDRVKSLGLLGDPAAPPASGSAPFLADAKLRPRMLGLYY